MTLAIVLIVFGIAIVIYLIMSSPKASIKKSTSASTTTQVLALVPSVVAITQLFGGGKGSAYDPSSAGEDNPGSTQSLFPGYTDADF